MKTLFNILFWLVVSYTFTIAGWLLIGSAVWKFVLSFSG